MAANDTTTRMGSASPHGLVESDRVEGTAVFGAGDEAIGNIKRLMIDKTKGQVVYAVMGFGGIFGLGEDHFTIPWNKLAYDTRLGGYRTDITRDQLEAAPDFSRGDVSGLRREREQALHEYWGAPVYWGF